MSSDEPIPETESANGYEFTAEQNETLNSLAGEMRWVSLPLLILGGLNLISVVGHVIMAFRDPRVFLSVLIIGLGAVLWLALGLWTKQASESFRKVVATRGNDIEHLMSALDNLRKKYSLLALFVKIYVAFLIIGLLVTVILWAMGNLSP